MPQDWFDENAPKKTAGSSDWFDENAPGKAVVGPPPSLWQRLITNLTSGPLAQAAGKPTGEMPGSFEGHPENIGAYVPASAGEIAGGVKDIAQGKVAGGMHRIFGGLGNASLPVAALVGPAAVAAAPVTTGLSVVGGYAGQKGAQKGAEALGATPDQAALAGDIGGFAGGYTGAKVSSIGKALGSRTLPLRKTPQEAYQSALKPSRTIPMAKANRLISTALEEGIPVSKGGVDKL